MLRVNVKSATIASNDTHHPSRPHRRRIQARSLPRRSVGAFRDRTAGVDRNEESCMTRQYSVRDTARFAQNMRTNPTATESKLSNALTDALSKTTARVHLQHIIGPYIADLYIPYAQLIIEADGSSHTGRKQYDERRESYMRDHGYRTIRFTNTMIWSDCKSVVGQIIVACGELKPHIPGEVKITYCPPRRAAGRYRMKMF